MQILRLTFLLVFVVTQLRANMWDIIAKQNEKYLETKAQQDDNGDRLVGGDIHMNIKDWSENRAVFKRKPKIQHSPQQAPTYQQLQPIFDYHRKLWKRRIPYVITNSIRKHATVIKSSLAKISAASCLTFFEVGFGGGGHKNWIEFYKGQGCFSGIGRKYYRKAATKISLGNYCEAESIIIHEVLHALGFYHEQARRDRDSYLTVSLNRVQKSLQSNFEKNDPFESNYAGTPYDVDSIMQYGNTAFRISATTGDVMQNKFEPGKPLGGSMLSKYDILELNRRYQCPHVELDGKSVPGAMKGFSQWSKFTECGSNWRGQCSRARYRICVDSDNCQGANEYGTQEEVVECPKSKCTESENRVDGMWGAWGEFGPCQSKCGWGVYSRTRDCNNPTPSINPNGFPCQGFNIERRLCRRARCTGAAPYDLNFEKGFGSWTAKNFQRKQGSEWKRDGILFGPGKDHTSIVDGKQGGFYAMAKKKKGWSIGTDPTGQLTSYSLPKIDNNWCLSFYYLLNGRHLHKTNAVRVYVKYSNGQASNSNLFTKGGHVSKDWRYVAIPLANIPAGSRLVIESQFRNNLEGSAVGIDDIILDSNECLEGLNDCLDIDKDCESKANNGHCSSNWRYMLRKCCKTCQDPKFKIDSMEKPTTNKPPCTDSTEYTSKCVGWAKTGECQKNPKWMSKNCCVSCKKYGSKSKISERTLKPTPKPSIKPFCADNTEYVSKCVGWAKKGECGKNPKWMSKNCCVSCKKYDCSGDNSSYKEKCLKWAKEEYCANNTWMAKNCCASCSRHCTNKHKDIKECEKWAKNKEQKYCKTNDFVKKNCCGTCYEIIKEKLHENEDEN